MSATLPTCVYGPPATVARSTRYCTTPAAAESFQRTSIRLSEGMSADGSGGSGAAAQPHWSNLKAAMRVPPLPPYCVVNQNVQSSAGSTPIPA